MRCVDMRFISKVLLTGLLACSTVTAQKPVGITGFVGNYLDYYMVNGGNPSGDTYYFTAWAANSMLSQFPDPTGLPIVGTLNDGTSGACSGNIEFLQLSKLPDPFTTPTSGNTLITPYSNCLSSFGTASGATSLPTGWSGQLTGGDGHNDGTWKGMIMAFRNNILLAPVYRQTSAGNAFGDSTLALSPDAGQTWIDYGRYNTYTVAGASCSGTTVTLNATNALSAGQKIYVHDIVPSGYNRKATLIVATGTTVQYNVGSCPGTYSSGGGFGILSADGSAPFGPGDASYPADMMWPVTSSKNPMNVQRLIAYGQDGNYPAGIEAACDPTVWVCGLSSDNTNTAFVPLILYRHPVSAPMDKSQYQWYSCAGYNSRWPVAETTCDGNLSGSWTSTIANATVLMYMQNASIWPGERGALTYLPSHGSYTLSGLTRDVAGTRISYNWAPHPWGPYYPTWNSDCWEDQVAFGCGPGFNVLMPYGGNVISSSPPLAQMRISSDIGPGRHTPGGNPLFWALEVAGGRVPFAGMARRADYLNAGQLGMGHRFVSGNMSGAISRRGLAWWADLWDHGGITVNANRPYFRDVLSGGSNYFNVMSTNGTYGGNRWGNGASLGTDGVQLFSGYAARLESSFSDTTLSANSGNSSWTFVAVFKITAPTGTGVQNEYGRQIPVMSIGAGASRDLSIDVGLGTAGNLCVNWDSKSTSFCTTSAVISANTWYSVAVSANANGSGYPTVTMYLGSAGTITEYGGVSMATAANGTTGGGLIKACSSNCAATPAVGSAVVWLGYTNAWDESMNGVIGEAGLYSGVAPSHVIREIYRTLRTDWTRVGRGSL